MDLRDRFDLATSDGPSHAPLETRLRLGRRAARRRVAGRAVGSLAVAATAAAGVAALTTGQDRATEPASPPVAVAPPASRTSHPITEATSDDGWAEDEWARMDDGGNITVRRGVDVMDSLDSAVPAHLSVALDLSLEGERLFVLLVRNSGGIVTSSWDEPAGRSLKRFAAEEVDPLLALPIVGEPGRLGADLPLVGYDHGELYTVPGAVIVRVVEDPIEGWCTRHATAAVEVLYSGVTYFAVLAAGNCEAAFSELGRRTPTLEATVAALRANLE